MSEQYVLGPNEDDDLDELTDEVDGPVPFVLDDSTADESSVGWALLDRIQ